MSRPSPAPLATVFLFGGSRPWSDAEWTSSDDRVRGGRSQSYLSPSTTSARFHGHLDITALGGAGFASQRTTGDLALDLSPYAGLRLDVARCDNKTYTLTLKDELLPPRDDGREQSGVSWEAEFRPGAGGATVWLPWTDFRATYRGREKRDAEPLRTERVRRIGLMMRSFFGDQEGDFDLIIRSIAALTKDEGWPYRDDPSERRSLEAEDEKGHEPTPSRQGWLAWLAGSCIKL